MITPYNEGANFQAWHDNIMSTSTDKVSLPAKCIAIALVELVYEGKPFDSRMYEGHCKVYDWQIANRIGMNRRSIIRLRKQIAPCFSILQRSEWIADTGNFRANYYLPGEAILNGLLCVDNKNNRSNGQKNYTCRECGSEEIEHIITHEYKCLACGHVHRIKKGEVLSAKYSML